MNNQELKKIYKTKGLRALRSAVSGLSLKPSEQIALINRIVGKND